VLKDHTHKQKVCLVEEQSKGGYQKEKKKKKSFHSGIHTFMRITGKITKFGKLNVKPVKECKRYLEKQLAEGIKPTKNI